MAYSCRGTASPPHSNKEIGNLKVLKQNILKITNAPWCVTNEQLHNDLKMKANSADSCEEDFQTHQILQT